MSKNIVYREKKVEHTKHTTGRFPLRHTKHDPDVENSPANFCPTSNHISVIQSKHLRIWKGKKEES